MEMWLDKGPNDGMDPILDLPALEVIQHSLVDARAAAIWQSPQDQDDTMTKARKATEAVRALERELQERAPANIKAIMRLIEPTLRDKDAEGTKKQKISCIAYCTTFCAAYWFGAEAYVGALPCDERKRTLKVQEEIAILAGFSGYVVMYPRQRGKAHNIIAHAERAVSVVKAHYKGRNGRTPRTRASANFEA